MKYILAFIFLMLFLVACNQDSPIQPLDRMLSGQEVSKETAISIIDKAYDDVESKKLKFTTKKEIKSGVEYVYTIYRLVGKPVKITSDISAETYNVQANYFIHDSIPYYIHGTMRDQDRASGNYTHQELYTYLDGKKIIKQLGKTAFNQENRSSNLSDIPIKDITNKIQLPDLDASKNNEEVINILRSE